MGNAASCTPSLISNNGVLKILLSDGRLEAYKKPMRAAELMLEYPGQFVCDSCYLKVGHRIHGLLADDQLERRKFYFLLPMELLYSVLTHEEMSSLNYKASRATKHATFNNLGKIFPVFSELCMFPSELKRLEEADNQLQLVREPEPPVQRYSKQRSWRPALETVDETL
ncbi:hypothetical protein AAZX31_08G053700 [Glycine max]|uniref:Uncharacterized protein n=2 Tax=Glycine subgen. Soja TaxID=1462606 RepID=C6TJR4_SOYBN|nr:uncharacterized protein LOC100792772 [Glycine max]XP_028247127.1 uncharacterized protein LOC114424470 [Glycine soja]ACU23154.1 unknown [Glycine max]KAG4999367.1 hypothetical protein JHK87_020439 [Glycine soja]KAG5024637.1 hypothetical protein JHK86_020551 [Glycine max]KAG5135807.1 hypothetical protein JHK82_020538 [Glycine max]KAH1049777.1 hypothetical protein GYH30_020338 [Glycine max]|eukprot:NP_001241321.1 uncharacterized protein LOC100792772 [Glycine max]